MGITVHSDPTTLLESLQKYWGDEPVDPAFLDQVKTWLTEGKGIAVYENHDMGHYDLGRRRFFAYGQPDCSFPDEPPERLPDFPREINWRYMLVETFRGDPGTVWP